MQNHFAGVVSGNLMTAVNCTKAALDELIKTRGSVIFISSIATIHGLPTASAYCASKMGLEKFAESLRIEMHPHGVHVGVVRLGLVDPHPDKTVLRDDGISRPVPRKKGHQTLESTARAALRMVRHRKPRITMTLLGKATSIVDWVAPWFIRIVLTRNQYSEKLDQ